MMMIFWILVSFYLILALKVLVVLVLDPWVALINGPTALDRWTKWVIYRYRIMEIVDQKDADMVAFQARFPPLTPMFEWALILEDFTAWFQDRYTKAL